MPALLIIGMGKGKSNHKGGTMNPMESFLSGKQSEDKEPLVESPEGEQSKDGLTFNKPAGFKVPDGVKDGEPFDAMATVKVVNGKLVLAELDGAPVQDELPGSEEEESPTEGASESLEDEDTEGEQPEGSGEKETSDKPVDFLDAIEKGASKKEEEKKPKKGNPFKK